MKLNDSITGLMSILGLGLEMLKSSCEPTGPELIRWLCLLENLLIGGGTTGWESELFDSKSALVEMSRLCALVQ